MLRALASPGTRVTVAGPTRWLWQPMALPG